ncbi:MAG TPA: isoprenylcysteine carboxylmethyltransferase family protein [Gammaproteobacteria bacterium]|nr:isoprenylcysteine carboxylmethyltransferase family protein [Gammaproteobacteria bacterium]
MSHRTADLPPLTGIAHVIRELRYFEGARQGLAVVLVLLYTVTAEPIPALAAVGLVIGLAGELFRLYASGFIVKNQELATDGAYRFVRHPLYTGNILLVIGFALASSRWWAIPLALFFFWFYYPTAIEYEDRKLRRIFGAAWETWSSHTPALLPRFGAAPPAAPGNRRWSLAVSNSHGEVLFVAMALICAAWIAWEAFF